jgi:hypothetical protein
MEVECDECWALSEEFFVTKRPRKCLKCEGEYIRVLPEGYARNKKGQRNFRVNLKGKTKVQQQVHKQIENAKHVRAKKASE